MDLKSVSPAARNGEARQKPEKRSANIATAAHSQVKPRTRTELAAIWPPTAAVAREAGHERQSALKAIREKCVDCSGGSFAEARRCEAVKCPLWPFRAGKHPWIALREKPPSGAGGCGQGRPFQERSGVAS